MSLTATSINRLLYVFTCIVHVLNNGVIDAISHCSNSLNVSTSTLHMWSITQNFWDLCVSSDPHSSATFYASTTEQDQRLYRVMVILTDCLFQ